MRRLKPSRSHPLVPPQEELGAEEGGGPPLLGGGGRGSREGRKSFRRSPPPALLALKNLDTLLCEPFVPGSPCPVSRCCLRFLGSTVEHCAHVRWRILDDSRLCYTRVDLGSWDGSRPCSASRWRLRVQAIGFPSCVLCLIRKWIQAHASVYGVFGWYSTHFQRDGDSAFELPEECKNKCFC